MAALPQQPISRVSARWHRASRVTRWTLIVLAVLLVGLRLALPFGLKAYVNRQLNRSPGYRGRIGDVNVHLWRGAYRVHDIVIDTATADLPTPLFTARALDLSVQWRELFHGALVGEVTMEEPRVTFADGPAPEHKQTGKGADWSGMLESLFPFKLNRVDIEKGRFHFQNVHSKPPVDLEIAELSASATNLTNTRDLKQPLPAGVTARGVTRGGGGVDVALKLDPLAAAPTFELNAQVTNLDLVTLNDFLRAYGSFDVERGNFSAFTSVAGKEGGYEGYVKVFFANLDVFDWEKERKKNALEIFWQAIVGTLTTVFKNQPKDTLATKIPIVGTYDGTHVGIWSTITTLLRHAFIRALLPKLDQPVKVDEVRPLPDKPPETKPDNSPRPTPGKRVDRHADSPTDMAFYKIPNHPLPVGNCSMTL